MRICSLLPSATEILFALGLGDSVAGVTHECDYPPAAATRPVVVRPRVDAAASPAEVDRAVNEFAARGESIYRVDAGLLRAIEPDLILTQDLCHVCAASPDDLAAALAGMRHEPHVLALTPHTLAEVWDDIRKVGAATGYASRAEEVVAALERRVKAVEAAVANPATRPLVACLEWLDPPFCAGHWVPEMVERAGGHDVIGIAGKPSFRIEWEQVLDAAPDLIVVMPCGYNIARTVEEIEKLPRPAGWEQIPAVRAGRAFAVDANAYFSRPGPRLADGVALLAQLIHPECTIHGVPPNASKAI